MKGTCRHPRVLRSDKCTDQGREEGLSLRMHDRYRRPSSSNITIHHYRCLYAWHYFSHSLYFTQRTRSVGAGRERYRTPAALGIMYVRRDVLVVCTRGRRHAGSTRWTTIRELGWHNAIYDLGCLSRDRVAACAFSDVVILRHYVRFKSLWWGHR